MDYRVLIDATKVINDNLQTLLDVADELLLVAKEKQDIANRNAVVQNLKEYLDFLMENGNMLNKKAEGIFKSQEIRSKRKQTQRGDELK